MQRNGAAISRIFSATVFSLMVSLKTLIPIINPRLQDNLNRPNRRRLKKIATHLRILDSSATNFAIN